MSDLETILHHVPLALLVIFRIGGLMLYGPVFGSAVIPMRVKVFFSFLLGFAIYPLLSSQHYVGAGMRWELWTLVPLVTLELVIGLVIGYVASLPMLAMQTGGLMIGQQMGLGFAQLYNPAIDDEADVIGQMLFFLAVASFLIIGGHELMVLAVLHSFEYVPLGGVTTDFNMLALVTGVLQASFELAMRVAAPVLAIIYLETVAMGFLAKTVPQLNILSLGFPVRILVGMFIIVVGLVIMHDVMIDGMIEMFHALFEWIETAAWQEPAAESMAG